MEWGVGGATSSVSRVIGPITSMFPPTRGTRTLPTRISRDGFRNSRGVPIAAASARGTKSTGTNQERPSRAGGAGSEINRPPTDARLWPGVSTIDCVRAVTVSPPANVSSRTVSSKSFVRSSSANIS